jgi:S-(hydroxymethyl)glutathione dehydrogenase/alcohol dehydrogenase
LKTPAAILVELRRPLALDEVEVPALDHGQVLVDIRVTRICGSQLGEIDGVKGPDKYLPHLLGHEGGGVVLETGTGVTQVKAGDHVVLHWRPGAGIAARGSQFKRGGSTVNAGPITTFNRLGVISENRLTPIPKHVDFELASLLADTLTTGFGVVTRDAKVEIGESVVIIGVGGIGLGAVLGAQLSGANPVIAVDIHDHKLANALKYGATHAINTRREPMGERVRSILGGPADAVFDGTGNPEVMKEAWAITAPKGRLVGIGVMAHDRELSINTLALHMGKTLTGSEGGQSRPHTDIPRFLRLLKDRKLDLSGFVTHRCGLEKINDGIAAMRAGESIHTMVHFQGEGGG